MEEVELGGLEDNRNNGPAFGPADDEYHLFNREEVRFLLSLEKKIICKFFFKKFFNM